MEVKLKNSLIKDWRGHKGRPFLIAGPCSAETEEQVMETATQLAKIKQVSVYRAGIWKPRTRPNSFEGVGIEGLNGSEGSNRKQVCLSVLKWQMKNMYMKL